MEILENVDEAMLILCT